MQLGRFFAGQVQQYKLVLANLHNSGDSQVRIVGRLRIRIVHFKKRARNAVGAIGGLLIHIHKHDVDIDHNTHSLKLYANTNATTQALACAGTATEWAGTFKQATRFRLIEQRISAIRMHHGDTAA